MYAKTKSTQTNGDVPAVDENVDVMPGSSARPVAGETFETVLDRAISRRTVLKGAGYFGATMVIAPAALMKPDQAQAKGHGFRKGHGHRDPGRRLTFETIPPGNEADVVVPNHYSYDVILRWGDPLFPGAPAFDLHNQTGASQAQQFGFNADLVLWYPLPDFVRRSVDRRGELGFFTSRLLGSIYPKIAENESLRAVMVVNHEYTSGEDMFPVYDGSNPSQDQVETEIEAHGFAVIGVKLQHNGSWKFDIHSPFNRRVTGSTAMEITGPLRGNDLLKTVADPSGTEVLGCLNNCAGGKTPWGTVLTCEENFDQYFANFSNVPDDIKHFSLRIPGPGGASGRKWENYVGRFDLSQEPKEYNRFGYIVEIDPYDPSCKPKKRTALGRFKHEGAAATIAKNGRVAVYSGDDARFEYLYKFVSNGRFNRYNRQANMDLLDDGILYAAQFNAGSADGDEMGDGLWLPLVWEPGNALDAAGFSSQAEVLLNTRGAADVLGATPMDRPEDVEVSPKNGNVYMACTNNSQRNGNPGDTRTANGRVVSTAPNESNPRNDTYDDGDPDSRTGNQHGHVIELIEKQGDAAATRFKWNVFIKCGDPAVASHDTRFGNVADPVAEGVSPISDPDNLVHDDDGNLWIATDGQYFSGGAVGFGQNDGIFAVPVEGKNRGVLRQFLSGVPGGEVCGPEFSGDNRSLFCAIQHPNDGNAFNEVWPIGDPDGVSKPSLIGVRHDNRHKKIGS